MQRKLTVLTLANAPRPLTAAHVEALLRSRFYASHVRKYFVVGLSLRSHKLKPERFGNIFMIPTKGLNRPHAIYRMYKLADQICRENQIDIIQATEPTFTGLIGYVMKKKYGKPLNVCVVGCDPYNDDWLRVRTLNRLLALTSRRVLNACDGVQVDARRVINNLIKKGKVPCSKIFYLPFMPHDIKDFKDAEGQNVRHQLLTENETKFILFVGRLAKQKNVRFLLRCFYGIVKKFPKVRLVIVGEGQEENNLKGMARKLRIADKIDWIRFVPRPRLAEYFRATDVFVLCSFFEGTPKVLMEAAMAGKPIVSTDVGGVEAVIEQGKSGFIVPQRDKEEFIEKTLFLLNNPEIARKMGRSGQQTVARESDPQKMISRQIEVWSKIISRVTNMAHHVNDLARSCRA